MVKLEELSEEQLENVPDEVKQAILNGKEELVKARGVIGTLNKKIKGGDDDSKKTGEEGNQNLSQEELEKFYQEKKTLETLESFIAENPVFEDKKDDLTSLVKEKGLSIEGAKAVILAEDKTFANNVKTNQTGISGVSATGQNDFMQKIKFEDYKNLTSQEQEVYKQSCAKNYGGLTFADKLED